MWPMPAARCPRCGGALADSASVCAGCARPVTLDLTARVPKKSKPSGRRLFWRGGVVASAAVIAVIIHYATKE